MNAAHALMSHAIDYAGMFPPAGFDLETAVTKYESHRAGDDAWALGRLVLPVSALAEFADRWPERVRTWPISLLLGEGFTEEIQTALGFGFAADVVEYSPERIEHLKELRRLLRAATLFIGMRPQDDLDNWLAAMAAQRTCAKIRMGGVTASAVPPAAFVAAFLSRCARHEVRFKATAGLHHAICAQHALAYAKDPPRAQMYGFVNLFVASMLARRGEEQQRLADCLNEDSPDAFTAADDFIAWREKSFATDFATEEIERMRGSFAGSFGSCSFEEPLADLRAMGWIE